MLMSIAKYASVVFFNVIMWLCHVESPKALSSFQATVANFVANFLSSGLAGFFLFGEVLSAKALDRDEDAEVTPNDVFLHVHMKDHDGVTFINNRSAQFHAELMRKHEEHTQATPDRPIDEKQLYYDATGECSKGRVYGLESLTKGRGDMKIPVPVSPDS
ncbi:hypothetical protein Syun_001656 [Stephania yunnanensis]|uniref:Uncharacterized protein n=1 Tax=Stephania yunnanensis TaxID=152371 RepID=A0AAP0LEJ7_9MAGN